MNSDMRILVVTMVEDGDLRGNPGRSTAQIARSLSFSPETVAKRVSAILGKLQVADRVHVTVKAHEAGPGTRSSTRYP